MEITEYIRNNCSSCSCVGDCDCFNFMDSVLKRHSVVKCEGDPICSYKNIRGVKRVIDEIKDTDDPKIKNIRGVKRVIDEIKDTDDPKIKNNIAVNRFADLDLSDDLIE